MMIQPETTIADLLRAHPEIRPLLQAKGIDLCCGGGLTLRQVAEVRGLPVESLLAELRGPAIQASDSVRQVLARHPAAVAVFEKHSLMGCGGRSGPDERIDLFAAVHHIDVNALLGELNEAATRGAEAVSPAEPAEAAPLFPAFLKAALACTLTMGATFGAFNLLGLHLDLWPVPAGHHWVHAGFQVWGFVLLFIMGVAVHAVPRFLGAQLRHTGLARAALWLTVLSLILVMWGRFGALLPGSVAALTVGALLQLAAVAAWGWALFATWRRAGSRRDLFVRFLGAGTIWWIAAAAFLGAGAVLAILDEDADSAAAWNQAMYTAALFGGTLAWIQGMFLRTGPVFLNLKPTRRGLVEASFWVGQAGALVGTIGAARLGHPGAILTGDMGLLATAASVVLFCFGVRPFSGGPGHLAGADPAFGRIVRLAFAGALLFVGLAAFYVGVNVVGVAHKFLHDGMRHAFTLGFVTLIIFAMAGRVVPVFTGNALRWPGLRVAGAYLIVAGVLLREAQIAVAMLEPMWPIYLSGVSGVVGGVGVILAGASIWGTLYPRSPAEPAPAAEVPISGDANVAALVAAHPEALPILVEAGFTPLANPVLRRTMARMVTLRQACRMHGVDLEAVLERIRRACAPAWTPARLLDRETLLETLREVIDPELGADVVDLGLIYDVAVAGDGKVDVRMTLTAPGCPHAQDLVGQVREVLGRLPGVKGVEVEVVFDPPWSPDRMSPAVRARLGISSSREDAP